MSLVSLGGKITEIGFHCTSACLSPFLAVRLKLQRLTAGKLRVIVKVWVRGCTRASDTKGTDM